MKVQDIMTKEPSCCDPETNAAAAAELMFARNCGALPVVGAQGRLMGIVTDRDLFIALGTNNTRASDLLVGALMANEIATCTPNDDVRTALKTMAQHRVQRLPVVDKTRVLKGILSIDDIVLRVGAGTFSSEDVLTTIRAIWSRQVQRQAGGIVSAAAG